MTIPYVIYQKIYDGESIIDMTRNVFESLDPNYNPQITNVPVDRHGLHLGKFKLTIEWLPEQ